MRNTRHEIRAVGPLTELDKGEVRMFTEQRFGKLRAVVIELSPVKHGAAIRAEGGRSRQDFAQIAVDTPFAAPVPRIA